MEDAATPAELLGGRPRWLGRRQFAVWSIGADLIGWVLWGHLGDDDAEQMKQLWLGFARRIARPYDFVLDLRTLASVSAGAYARVREFAFTPKPGMRRQAVLVTDEEPGGAIQLGLFALRPPEHAWRQCRSYDEVSAWFERSLDLVEARTRAQLFVPAPLGPLRAMLMERPRASMQEAARALGCSPRTLQRTLRALGTSFSAELDHARVMVARELLRAPDSKLDAVALAAGCADRKSLNRIFRRVTGESPDEFRRRMSAGLSS